MIEIILAFAVGFLIGKVYLLTKKIEDLKTEKQVSDRFVNANMDTLYKRTERNANTLSYIDMPIKVPFYMSLPSTGLYTPEQLKEMEKEYDQKWEKFLDYKEKLKKVEEKKWNT